MINTMHETGGLMSMELQNELKQHPCIYFDLQYPTPNFESIYTEIIQIKQHLGNQIKILIFYEGRKDTDQRFHNNKEISLLRLGNSVQNIEGSFDDGSFVGCSSLTSVSIPSSVTSIGNCVFGKCAKLNDMQVIPFKEKKINYLENKFLVFKSDAGSDIYDILLWVNPKNEIINVPGFIKTIENSAFSLFLFLIFLFSLFSFSFSIAVLFHFEYHE